MKVIILAAGKGSRLSSVDTPKPLTSLVNGQSILDHQLEGLSRYTSLSNVIVVVGYRKEEIMERFPNLLYVYNPDFAKENTSKSLLRALNKCNEDVLWMNGDVVYHPSILKSLFDLRKTGMVVNIGKVGDEEVKYRQDKHGRILEVSKTVAHPEGEALGINFAARRDLKQLCNQLERCAPNDYFEKGLEGCIEEGMAVWSFPIDAGLCTEIDFPEDLERANAMLGSW
jgi:L-glutamine-phosphate cytidylyltransferase